MKDKIEQAIITTLDVKNKESIHVCVDKIYRLFLTSKMDDFRLQDEKSYSGKEIATKFYDWTNTTPIDRLTNTEELFNIFLKDEL